MMEWKTYQTSFDGASKNNPWMAREREVILYHDGNVEIEYSWGLGTLPNNSIEAYGLLQGLLLAKDVKIEELVMLSDSQLVIIILLLVHCLKITNSGASLIISNIYKTPLLRFKEKKTCVAYAQLHGNSLEN